MTVIRCITRGVPTARIRWPLYWDEDDNNVNHLWDRHKVTPDEIEEIVFGTEDDRPGYLMFRSADGYIILGRTPDGRLLKVYGEFIEAKKFDGLRFRPIHAMDMNSDEKRRFKERLK
jgi:hypothetical protein